MTKPMNAMNKRQTEQMMNTATLAVLAWAICATFYIMML